MKFRFMVGIRVLIRNMRGLYLLKEHDHKSQGCTYNLVYKNYARKIKYVKYGCV